MGRYPEADLQKLRLISVDDRPTRVSVEDFGRVDPSGSPELLDRLPRQLAGNVIREVVEAVVRAREAGRPVVLLVGAHVIKVGASPYLNEWMRQGIVSHLAVHGAGAVHDLEIARFGNTSEDVEAHLQTGQFGLVEETGQAFFEAVGEAHQKEEGLGEALGRMLSGPNHPHAEHSLLATAYRHEVPATVHVAVGTDTVHAHPTGDGAALGESTLRDFRILAASLGDIEGGVVLNLGSAVLLPEVFLKALTVAVHLGASMKNVTTVNLDQIQHYRPRVNVVERPTRAEGARGLTLTGHHEILIPMVFENVLARLSSRSPAS